MRMIKKFEDFIKEEAISGAEYGIGKSFGPGSPDSSIPNTINYNDTSVILADDNRFYTIDEYNDIYTDYLGKGGTPLDGFNKKNIDIILDFFKNYKKKMLN
jgi:hypothetical protein